MKIESLALSGLYLIHYDAFKDNRGAFKRIFCVNSCKDILADRSIVQINISSNTEKGTVRGMHLQTQPYSELKIIQCMKGRVWDVAVDVRTNSPTFMQYQAVELSEDDDIAFVIPEGFAHGFQVLEENSELLYFHTCKYTPDHGETLNPKDPKMNIQWPQLITNLSDKDKNQPFIDSNFKGYASL